MWGPGLSAMLVLGSARHAAVEAGPGVTPPGGASAIIGGVARRVSSPVVVGRDAEAAQLRAALERAAGGRPAIVLVAGEAGVGKTRLVTDLVGRAGELGAVALTGGCLDVGDGVLAYMPLGDLLGFLVWNLRGGVALVLTYRGDELHRRHPLRPFLAELDRSGRAERLELGRLGRRDLAELLARAWVLADGLGARPLAAEVASLARRARIDLPEVAGGGAEREPAAGAPAVTDELGLTPREREVLALVADGRTNRQIAEALFISNKTASVHVSNILAKPGMANRGEAAAVAHRLRLTG
jgi:DNA-binding CsgD family transcriptional regulator